MNYQNLDPSPNKYLQPDGSVTELDGTPVSAANPAGAAAYVQASPIPNKCLNADGSITPFPTGGGGGGGSMTLIATIAPAGDVNQFEFTNIPQTFSHLRIIGQVACQTGGILEVSFNHGSGAAWGWQSTKFPTGGPAVTQGSGVMPIAYPSSNGYGGGFTIDVPNYRNADVIAASDGYMCDASGYPQFVQSAVYGSTQGPVTDILITTSTGNTFFAGENMVSLYGIS